MNDLGLFIAGSVVFVLATWAVIAFGLARFQELYRIDLSNSEPVRKVIEDTYTEIYSTR